MNRTCARCGGKLGPGPRRQPNEPITHGICESCSRFFSANGLESLRGFLDSLDAPLMLVDSAGVVLTANARACADAGKQLQEIEGLFEGTMVDCAHAGMPPRGCGASESCAACEIRGSVTRTFETGLALDHVEAYLDVRTAAGGERRLLNISTERVDRVVILRLDGTAGSRGPGRTVSP